MSPNIPLVRTSAGRRPFVWDGLPAMPRGNSPWRYLAEFPPMSVVVIMKEWRQDDDDFALP